VHRIVSGFAQPCVEAARELRVYQEPHAASGSSRATRTTRAA
jgi:hypothetical protein